MLKIGNEQNVIEITTEINFRAKNVIEKRERGRKKDTFKLIEELK